MPTMQQHTDSMIVQISPVTTSKNYGKSLTLEFIDIISDIVIILWNLGYPNVLTNVPVNKSLYFNIKYAMAHFLNCMGWQLIEQLCWVKQLYSQGRCTLCSENMSWQVVLRRVQDINKETMIKKKGTGLSSSKWKYSWRFHRIKTFIQEIVCVGQYTSTPIGINMSAPRIKFNCLKSNIPCTNISIYTLCKWKI